MKKALFYAIAAALCFGVGTPVSKLLLRDIAPAFMASALYLGAGFGMCFVSFLTRNKGKREATLSGKDIPFTIAMIVLDVAAPVLLMLGLSSTSPAAVSLLNNFEIVITTLIAMTVFKEAAGARVWAAIVLITIASIILSVDDFSSLSLSAGSIFILLACACWGLENNCTRMLSLKNPLQIVIVKGLGSGTGALVLGLILRQPLPAAVYVIPALLLGFAAYGLSIAFYILAQRTLGAARTSAYYSFAPFIGVTLSFVIFRETITLSFLAALLIMIAGTYFIASEKHGHLHSHKELAHDHRHSHNDGHHTHPHDAALEGEHSHFHTHESVEHAHAHTPDLHHSHTH